MNCPKCNYSGEPLVDDFGNKRCPECKTLIEGAPRRPVEKKEVEVSDLPESAATYSAEAKRELYGEAAATGVFELFISIWYKPRVAIRQILDNVPDYWMFVISGIAGLLIAVFSMDSIFTFVTIAIAGPILIIVNIYIMAAVLAWTGHWLGGKAPSESVRSAIVWGFIPWVTVLVLLMIFVISGIDTSLSGEVELDPTLGTFFLLFGLYGYFFIFLNCLAEVQEFSIVHAFVNLIIGSIVFSIIGAVFDLMLGSCLGC